MKDFRLPILLGFVVALATSGNVAAQSPSEYSDHASNSPAFLTSMPTQAEPSLFESAITQKNSELEQCIQRLESELNQIHHYSTHSAHSALEHQLQQQDIGSGGLFGTIEVTFLKPHLSGATPAFGLATNRMINAEYSTGIRYILGYTSDSGLGVRARYWSYNDDFGFVPPFAPSQLGIQLSVADAEVTLGQQLRHWDLEVSGGLRYGKLQYSNATPSLFGVGYMTFEGVGPTASLSARRALSSSGVSLFGNVRGSMMIGDIRNGSLLTYMPAGTIEEEIMTVAENQMGIAWTRDLSATWQLQVRTAWETQYWMSSAISDDVYGIGSNLALTGPTIAVELCS